MLIVADNALQSAEEATIPRNTSKRAKKFKKAIYLLSRFDEDFRSSFKDLDGSRTVTGEAKLSDESKSILYAFEESLYDAKVKFLPVPLPLNADES